MHLIVVDLWRQVFASGHIHPIFAGPVHREHTRLRKFGEFALDMFIVGLIVLPAFSAPLYAGILGYLALNQTRILIYRLQSLDLYDMVAVSPVGHMGTLWGCFAAWFHIYTDSFRFWRIYTLVLLLFGLLMWFSFDSFIDGTAITSLNSFLMPDFLPAPTTAQVASRQALVVTVFVFMVLDIFMSLSLGGLLAMLSAFIRPGIPSRVAAEVSYVAVKGGVYTLLYAGATRLYMADFALAWALAPAALLVYIIAHEVLHRILWNNLQRRSNDDIYNIAATVAR
ncbi:MAG: hypothetical protein AAF125_17705 [Chloroflexota bacterium]